MIRELSANQTHDPARGSFMVKPRPVTVNGKAKLHRGLPVYLSAATVEGQAVIPHPDSFQFVVVQ